MTDRERNGRYAWVTWITGHLSGDRDCDWQSWYKANYQYEKRHDDRSGELAIWKAQHADMVRARVEGLLEDGWTVYVEGQNKIKVEGSLVTIGGQPDIVAVRGDEARVEDCKTGQQRDSDFWQVVVYMVFLPLTHDAVGGRDLVGAVVYRDGEVPVPYPDDAMRARVMDQIKSLASEEPPRRTPSYAACSWCDIASCPDRVTEEATVTTEEF